MASRGRPVSSIIRQNIVEILAHIGKGYGYDIYKNYLKIYPKVTLRSIYYHLKKGLITGEFEIEKIEREKGDYSWGEMAEKVYYRLGTKAIPLHSSRVKDTLEK
ncbi:MAG: hypothetical protein ABIJ34_05095 [archaeon]